MTKYTVEMMTVRDYSNYMTGSNNYYVAKVEIEAETKEEAIIKAKAENTEMVINEKTVMTAEEIEAKYEALRKADREIKEKMAEEKRKKAEKEEAKAKAMGMTVEEYKAYKKEEAKVRRYEREIKAMEEEIAKMKKDIEYRKNYIAKARG